MIWSASDRSPGILAWRSNGPELELQGSVLTLRQHGTSFQFDLASPGVEMTMHHFGMMRGSILRLRSGATEMTVAGEAYAATDSPYADEPLKDAQLFLPKAEFESFHRALAEVRRTLVTPPTSELSRGRRSFLLWGNLDTYRDVQMAGLVVGLALMIGTVVVKLRLPIFVHHPDIMLAVAQIAGFIGILYWLWWKLQRGKPALLAIEGDTFTLSRLKTRATLHSWNRKEAEIRLTAWKTSASRVSHSQLLPVVEIRIHGELVVAAALNAQRISPGAPRGRSPRYTIDRLWTSTFLDCVVPETAKKGLSIEPVSAA